MSLALGRICFQTALWSLSLPMTSVTQIFVASQIRHRGYMPLIPRLMASAVSPIGAVTPPPGRCFQMQIFAFWSNLTACTCPASRLQFYPKTYVWPYWSGCKRRRFRLFLTATIGHIFGKITRQLTKSSQGFGSGRISPYHRLMMKWKFSARQRHRLSSAF